ncbi:hypothetical protein QUB63_12680 [Microcoleus sp. ARI1-B5]|uniref:hypothetical protein n=1 Tax=unclassified Microcoleus TaxID=2642155 RepID=UPI002FD14606
MLIPQRVNFIVEQASCLLSLKMQTAVETARKSNDVRRTPTKDKNVIFTHIFTAHSSTRKGL